MFKIVCCFGGRESADSAGHPGTSLVQLRGGMQLLGQPTLDHLVDEIPGAGLGAVGDLGFIGSAATNASASSELSGNRGEESSSGSREPTFSLGVGKDLSRFLIFLVSAFRRFRAE